MRTPIAASTTDSDPDAATTPPWLQDELAVRASHAREEADEIEDMNDPRIKTGRSLPRGYGDG